MRRGIIHHMTLSGFDHMTISGFDDRDGLHLAERFMRPMARGACPCSEPWPALLDAGRTVCVMHQKDMHHSRAVLLGTHRQCGCLVSLRCP